MPAGNYTVDVTDGEGCVVSTAVTVGQEGSNLSVNLEVKDESCSLNDGAIKAKVSGGQAPFEYNWSNGETQADISDLIAGTYTLVVTDANGCSVTAQGDVAPAPMDCRDDLIDLELIKRVNVETPQAGDTIRFQLTVFNLSLIHI